LEFDDIIEDDEQIFEEDVEQEGVIRDNNDVIERVVRRV